MLTGKKRTGWRVATDRLFARTSGRNCRARLGTRGRHSRRKRAPDDVYFGIARRLPCRVRAFGERKRLVFPPAKIRLSRARSGPDLRAPFLPVSAPGGLNAGKGTDAADWTTRVLALGSHCAPQRRDNHHGRLRRRRVEQSITVAVTHADSGRRRGSRLGQPWSHGSRDRRADYGGQRRIARYSRVRDSPTHRGTKCGGSGDDWQPADGGEDVVERRRPPAYRDVQLRRNRDLEKHRMRVEAGLQLRRPSPEQRTVNGDFSSRSSRSSRALPWSSRSWALTEGSRGPSRISHVRASLRRARAGGTVRRDRDTRAAVEAKGWVSGDLTPKLTPSSGWALAKVAGRRWMKSGGKSSGYVRRCPWLSPCRRFVISRSSVQVDRRLQSSKKQSSWRNAHNGSQSERNIRRWMTRIG
jgi:hypothetical protein